MQISSLLRTGTAVSPAAEVWQHLQLQKKAQANEEGVSKVPITFTYLIPEKQENNYLSFLQALSLIDDLMQNVLKLQKDQVKLNEDLRSMKEQLNKVGE